MRLFLYLLLIPLTLCLGVTTCLDWISDVRDGVVLAVLLLAMLCTGLVALLGPTTAIQEPFDPFWGV